MTDLLIRGGTVIDGTGAPGRRADVALRDGRIAAIGTDLTKDGARIIDAKDRVARADVALGPCADGGYYAIACRRAHPLMFAEVEWSTKNVLEQTERAARACRTQPLSS